MPSTPPRRLLIDTDPGVDDAQAILLAASRDDAQIEAITVVGGNVGLHHTVRNACRIVDVTGGATPVYAGCEGALIRGGRRAEFVHGEDGLGDAFDDEPETQPQSGHAAIAIVERTRAHPGELTLVSLAPMTNLALALKLDPLLTERVAGLVIMGGASRGYGNVENVSAEFNVFSDPEAASIVLSAPWRVLPRLVDWQATLEHGWSFQQQADWAAIDEPFARFYGAISRKTVAFIRDEQGRPMMRSADALAMAVALAPEIVESSREVHVTVELTGEHTRGQTTFDFDGRLGKPPNVRLIEQVDEVRYLAMLDAAMRQ